MPFKPKEREYRSMSALSAAGEKRVFNSDCYVEGYATTYDKPYVLCVIDGIEFKEIIERGALNGADMSDVIMQYDHHGRVLARHSGKESDTLFLNPDDPAGLFIAADLSSTSASRDAYEDIRCGLVTQMSWAFVVAEGGEWWEASTHTRHITRISKIYDVSSVSIPANDQTEITARSLCERIAAEECQELAQQAEERNRVAAECAALLFL